MTNLKDGADLAKSWGIENHESYQSLSEEILKEINNAKLKEKSDMKLEDWQRRNHFSNGSNFILQTHNQRPQKNHQYVHHGIRTQCRTDSL